MLRKQKVKDKMNDNEEKNIESTSQGEIEKEERIQEISKQEEIIKTSEEKIESLEKEVNYQKDKLLRKAAEFENFKRRNENDKLNLLKYAAESFIQELLPLVDDFERSLVHIQNTKEVETIKEGIKLVYDKLMKVLSDQGVKPIEAIGKPFDVHFHDAVMQKKVENVQPHTVVEEFVKGYVYKDRVIRHSRVAVSEDDHNEVNKSAEEIIQ